MDYNYLRFLEICRNNQVQAVNDFLKDFYKDLWSGLRAACRHGNSAIVSRLIQEPGLDINYQNEIGWTAAHLAWRHTECVRILAETDRVDWNKADRRGRTPLYWALKYGHSDTVDIIVQQPNIDYNVKTEDGDTLAHAAVEHGNAKSVKALIGRVDWNKRDKRGKTPLYWALH